MTSQGYDAVIVGAGFGGIGAGIQLKRMGYDNFVILDREDDLGGTWHVNDFVATRTRSDPAAKAPTTITGDAALTRDQRFRLTAKRWRF